MAALGTPLTTLAAMSGHAGLRVFSRYVHPGEDEKTTWMARFDQAASKLTESARKPS